MKNIRAIICVMQAAIFSGCGAVENKDSEIASYESSEQESTPVQIVGEGVPAGIGEISWTRPAAYTTLGGFSGKVGKPAGHEGSDYIHTNQSVEDVPVVAAAGGRVAYIRFGCPQDSMFKHNNSARECGAGYGNHVVIDHGNNIYTRYGHLRPKSIAVSDGQIVSKGERIAIMGNSGRSELRHLHFELGVKAIDFDPLAKTQNFDRIFDPEKLYGIRR